MKALSVVLVVMGVAFFASACRAGEYAPFPGAYQDQRCPDPALYFPYLKMARNVVEGFASTTSAKPGDKVRIYVSVDTLPGWMYRKYSIEIHRVGWYPNPPNPPCESLTVWTSGAHIGKRYPFNFYHPVTEQIDTVAGPLYQDSIPLEHKWGCLSPLLMSRWAVADSFVVGSNWTSGMYMILLKDTLPSPNWFRIPLVVRASVPGSSSKVLVQSSFTTYQAYNTWGGGSFYSYGDCYLGGDLAADTVSFDRPYAAQVGGEFYRHSNETERGWEYPFVRWLEQMGYTVEYCTNLDWEDPAFRTAAETYYQLFLSLGHDEYWSGGGDPYGFQRNEWQDVLRNAQGKNFAFFCGNSDYWHITPLDNARRMVCRKCGTEYCDLWRDTTTWNRPEAQMLGVQYVEPYGMDWAASRPDSVQKPNHWAFAGTGLAFGDTFGWRHTTGIFPNDTLWRGLMGYEVDSSVQGKSPSGIQILARGGAMCNGTHVTGHVTYYESAVSGSRVFAGGSVNFLTPLAYPIDWGVPSQRYGIQDKTWRIIKNVLEVLSNTYHGGHITRDTVWTQGVYVTGDVTVDPGVKLRIQPGAVVVFAPNRDDQAGGSDPTRCELIVQGKLTAIGNASDSVVFTSGAASPQNMDWVGVRLRPGSVDTLKVCRISDCYTGVHADSAVAVVDSSTISNVEKYGIRVTNGRRLSTTAQGPKIRWNRILYGPLYGIYLQRTNNTNPNCTTLVWNNYVETSNYGIYVVGDSFGTAARGMVQLFGDTIVYPLSMGGLQAGIHLEGTKSAARVHLCRISSGIGNAGIECLNRSWAKMDSSKLISDISEANQRTAYGIYVWNAQSPNLTTVPNITWDSLANFDTGVRAGDMAKPLRMGINGNATFPGFNNLDGIKTYYVNYYHPLYIDSLRAENNWWGTNPPDPAKFWGWIDYLPYRTSPVVQPFSLPGGGPQGSELLDVLLPRRFELGQSYPNPATGELTIRFALPQEARVSLKVFNVAGQVVRNLVSEPKRAGYHSVRWDRKTESGHSAGPGVYFYRMDAGTFTSTKKLVLAR